MIGWLIFGSAYALFAVILGSLAIALLFGDPEDTASGLGLLLLVFCVIFAALSVLGFVKAGEHHADWDKARKQVDAKCSPYQVRNLHKSHNSFVFSCANNQRLRVVVAK